MKFDGVTVHGFRSASEIGPVRNRISRTTLSKWRWRIRSGRKSSKPIDVRLDFNKRRLLAEAWAGYCAKPAVADAKVLTFAKA